MFGIKQVLEAVEAAGYELLSAEISTYRSPDANVIITGTAAKDGAEYRLVGTALVAADGSGDLRDITFELTPSDPFAGLS